MAGVSTKDIKNRIRSMESTKQITKAMEMVAASKLRQAQNRITASRPYFEILSNTISDIVATNRDFTSPYLRQKAGSRVLYVVIAGDRGLAGGYNSNVIKLAVARMEGKEATVLPIGKAQVLRDGADVTIFAAGIMLHEALKAAAKLEEAGISAAVLDMYSIKPLDEQAVLEYAKKTGAVVVAENHSHSGGLYDAVLQVLAENHPVPAQTVSVKEEFGAVGSQGYLQKRFGLTAEKIEEAVHTVLKRKG